MYYETNNNSFSFISLHFKHYKGNGWYTTDTFQLTKQLAKSLATKCVPEFAKCEALVPKRICDTSYYPDPANGGIRYNATVIFQFKNNTIEGFKYVS